MAVFSKILVPVDLTQRAEAALRMALELVDPDGGQVWLLHVIEMLEGAEEGELEPFYGELEAKARAAMEVWRGAVEPGGVRLEERIVYGHRAREILRQVEELGCDLVILPTHRIDPDHPAGAIGTISHQVALVCDRPVLLLR